MRAHPSSAIRFGDDAEGRRAVCFDDLRQALSCQSAVFMDVAGIEPGRDVSAASLDEQVAFPVASCWRYIGKDWLDAKDQSGHAVSTTPRFRQARDRLGLEAGHSVVPVLVQGAKMRGQSSFPMC
jgi:hypothetical protein